MSLRILRENEGNKMLGLEYKIIVDKEFEITCPKFQNELCKVKSFSKVFQCLETESPKTIKIGTYCYMANSPVRNCGKCAYNSLSH